VFRTPVRELQFSSVQFVRCEYAFKLTTQRSRVQLQSVPPSGGNLKQVIHTHVPLSPTVQFGTDQEAMMSYGWESNRRSGVALPQAAI